MDKEIKEQENNDYFLFQEIFSGNPSGFGQHQPFQGDLKEGEKSRGKSWTVKEPITFEKYKKHLEGQIGLGVVPLKESKVKFAVIDIDNYNQKFIKNMIEKVYHNRLPFLPFLSKSGGLHLYLFFTEFVEFSKIKNGILEFLPVLGLKQNIEIFPKQKKLKDPQIGNWINLPYFNCKGSKQVLIGKDLKPLSLEAALKTIKQASLSLSDFAMALSNLYLNDAPPCIQNIYYNEDTAQRNEFLFNAAVYLKSKYTEDFEYELKELNNSMTRPLEEKELEATIIKSHRQRDYCYKCTQPPCSEFCAKELCKKRKYGISSEEISELSFEDFIQYTSDPPYYEWVVNGKALTFYQENDIIKQDRFRELCFRELHILPSRLKEATWTNIINRALKNIIIKTIALEDDISPGSMFLFNLHDFLENRVHAENLSQILIDRVYKEKENQVYIFKSKNLVDFLFIQKGFRLFKTTEIQSRLKRMGATVDRIYLDKTNKGVRVWKLPFKVVDELKVDIKNGLSIDFSNLDKKEEALY